MSQSHTLQPQPLTTGAFSPYGDVISTADRQYELINDGTAKKFADLAGIDVTHRSGKPVVSIYRADPAPPPLTIRMLERHPLSSQAFIPLDGRPFLVVVARTASVADIRVFVTNGHQGVNYKRNMWHHPLLALEQDSRFLVIERGGGGDNCETVELPDPVLIVM